METSQELTAPTWRKSSYSSSSGGDCVECAALGAAKWRSSSYSGNTGGECIEVAQLPTRIAIRDSKNPEGGAFTVSPAAFGAFVGALADNG